jgi:transcriptional regulator with XRE-family HTH domain
MLRLRINTMRIRNMSLGEVIRKIRKSQGLSIEAAAKKSGLSSRAVWALENGGGSIKAFDAVCSGIDLVWKGLPKPMRSMPKRVALLRKQRGLTVVALAARAGISRQALARLENGHAHIETLESALRGLRVELEPVERLFSRRWAANKDIRLTPPEIISKAKFVLDRIDLDPAGHENSFVDARKTYLECDDGLSRDWGDGQTTIFLNPPFSKSAVWLAKAAGEFMAGRSLAILALTSARTDSVGFQKLLDGGPKIIFLSSRLRFHSSDGVILPYTAPTPLILILWSRDIEMMERFRKSFDGVMISGGSI